MKDYLAIGAIYRDEARYLREWIEFHRLVGVERFHLYDNGSTDDHETVLAPYVAAGIATVTDWPLSPAGQCPAYADCLERHRTDTRWIAFIDIDEFLFSPTLRPLPEVLTDFEPYVGVGVNTLLYGSSGQALPPPGLVVENYIRRGADEDNRNAAIKSIVDPRRAQRCVKHANPHGFIYDDGFAVNEQMRPIDQDPPTYSRPLSYSLLRINHYWVKSEQQWREKMEQPMPSTGALRGTRPDRWAAHDARLSTVTDETILAYAPALRRALAQPAAATP